MKFYYNNRGEVKMITDVSLDTELNLLTYDPSKADQEKISLNYTLRVEDGELIFNKPIQIEKQQVEEAKALLQQKVKNKTLTLEDINDFIQAHFKAL